MLVLERKPTEQVVITVNGIEIVVEVISNLGRYIKLGFKAPKSVRIDRREIHEIRKREGKQ